MTNRRFLIIFPPPIPVRAAHVQVPDFSNYRRPNSGVEEGDYARRAFTYVLTGSVGVVGAHTAKNVVQDFLDTMSTSVR